MATRDIRERDANRQLTALLFPQCLALPNSEQVSTATTLGFATDYAVTNSSIGNKKWYKKTWLACFAESSRFSIIKILRGRAEVSEVL